MPDIITQDTPAVKQVLAELFQKATKGRTGVYNTPCPGKHQTLYFQPDGTLEQEPCPCIFEEAKRRTDQPAHYTEQNCEISETSELSPTPSRVSSHNSLISQPQEMAERQRPVLAVEAFQGAVGDLVKTIEPQTEADPVAILVQLLVGFGNVIGRNACHSIEASRHYCNLFAVIVGRSSRGRKGTSQAYARAALSFVDPDWASSRVLSGLSSGEGVIYEVRDPVEKTATNKKNNEVVTVIEDGGIEDKRLLVVEEEFARPLGVMRREGSTLSAILRQAWDHGNLRVMTKTPTRATNAHISIIGHITEAELMRYMADSVEVLNGFANRFLWIYADRTKRLPFGGNLDGDVLQGYYARLTEAYQSACDVEYVTWSAPVRKMWASVYEELSSDLPGMVGAVTSRAEAQVLRLMTIYALADGSDSVEREHMEAALALWEYSAATCAYLFGDSMGDPVADRILQLLRQKPEGLDRTALTKLFHNHVSGARLQVALDLLRQHGRAVSNEDRSEPGRPREVWHIATPERAVN